LALLFASAAVGQRSAIDCQGDSYLFFSNMVADWNGDEGTFSGYVALHSAVTDATIVRISAGGTDRFSIGWVNGTNAVSGTMDRGAETDQGSFGATLDDSQWHHLAMQWSLAGTFVRYYKDGVLAETDTNSTAWSAAVSVQRLCAENSSGTDLEANASLAHVQVLAGASANQAALALSSYRCVDGTGYRNQLAWFPFWQAIAASPFPDYSIKNADGTFTGSPDAVVSGPPTSFCYAGAS
jgi:hypothetical protein